MRPPGAIDGISRRRLLLAAGAAGGALAARPPFAAAEAPGESYPYYGAHQGGVVTASQDHLLFAAFDVTTGSGAELRGLLTRWCAAAARMCAGDTAAPLGTALDEAPADTGEALSLTAARLTMTIGLGPSLFDARFGLAARRPEALIDLPAFRGDRLDPARTGGDLCVQACADDPQVAFHAVRNLARAARGQARIRWTQAGFSGAHAARRSGDTARNLMGFKDGTNNLDREDAARMAENVWVGERDAPAWMRGGTYMVVRRIRIHIEDWDEAELEEQQEDVGRYKRSGAPIGGTRERDPVDPARVPKDCHIIQANPRVSGSEAERILRRGYSFADGRLSDGGADAGLFFVAFQRDPRRQFVPIQTRLAAHDALGEYLLHTGSGIFAVPPGCTPGGHVAERLFD